MCKIEVPYIDQSELYPTGCESVSAVMLLQYLGYSITVEEFIDVYLEKKPIVYRDGLLFGPNPYEYFVGSPYDETSFGCYAPVICRTLCKIIDASWEVIDETGKTLETLVETYIKKGIPVITWACINMREPIKGPSWRLETGDTFTWISNEHCMLLIGFDDEFYYFNDPYDNNGVIGYKREIVESRHRVQHMQAVAVLPR